jgi:hypothetical protein
LVRGFWFLVLGCYCKLPPANCKLAAQPRLNRNLFGSQPQAAGSF